MGEFGAELVAIARERPDVVALTAAMLHPTGLRAFTAAFPERVFDVGIAEQHAVTSAAGLAIGGLHPVVSLYATFLTRAVDQVLMDVGLHRLPVTFVLDRAGITGEDGPSHHGMWDLALLGVVPDCGLPRPRRRPPPGASPRRPSTHVGRPPCASRRAPRPPDLPARGRIGGADVLARYGTRRNPAGAGRVRAPPPGDGRERLAAAGEDVTVVDPRWLLPVDPSSSTPRPAPLRQVVTVEDHAGPGGYGDAFARALRRSETVTPLRTVDLGVHFVPHGSRGELLRGLGVDAAGIIETVRRGGPVRRRGMSPVLHTDGTPPAACSSC